MTYLLLSDNPRPFGSIAYVIRMKVRFFPMTIR